MLLTLIRDWARVMPLGALLASSVFGWARPANAGVPECIAAHSEGQLARDQSRLVEARKLFVACAASECPTAIRSACDELLLELEPRIPTVVLAAQDGEGQDQLGVVVALDKEPLEGALSGRAVAIDPGRHVFEFVAPDGRKEVVNAVIREWVKGRRIEARFRSGEPATDVSASVGASAAGNVPGDRGPSVPQERGSTQRKTWAYILGGAGLAGVLGFAYFGWSGRSERQSLESECAPNCSSAQRDGVRSSYLAADLLLAAGVVSLGAGAYLFVSTPDEPAVTGLPAGLITGVSGRF